MAAVAFALLLPGLVDRARSGRPTVLDGRTVEHILFLTTERVPVEATHWSTRLMARYAGVTQWQVRQGWQAADVKPHRLETFTLSQAPRFTETVIDVVGLYVNPPDSGLVLLVFSLISILLDGRLTSVYRPVQENRVRFTGGWTDGEP